jgi:hypothetical protein
MSVSANFRAWREGRRLIIENASVNALWVDSLTLRYLVSATTPTEESTRREIPDEVKLGRRIGAGEKIEVNLALENLKKVEIVYSREGKFFREDHEL